jgi:reactive chlorine resistance protein C
MTSHTTRPITKRFVSLSTIDTIASVLGRYSLVVVIGWIGALKFANFEAHQIQPLVAHSWAGSTTSYLCIRSQPY